MNKFLLKLSKKEESLVVERMWKRKRNLIQTKKTVNENKKVNKIHIGTHTWSILDMKKKVDIFRKMKFCCDAAVVVEFFVSGRIQSLHVTSLLTSTKIQQKKIWFHQFPINIDDDDWFYHTNSMRKDLKNKILISDDLAQTKQNEKHPPTHTKIDAKNRKKLTKHTGFFLGNLKRRNNDDEKYSAE